MLRVTVIFTQAAHKPAYNNGCCLLPKKDWTSSNLHTLNRRQQIPLKYGKSPHQATCPSFLEALFLLFMLWKPQLYFVSCCQIQVVHNTLQIIL